MATTKDAEAGWEIFKDSDFGYSLSEINDRLVARKHAPVSVRMYRHYQKLARYGYEYYIPINQLDVKTLQNPVWDRALRGRYLPRRIFASVLLRLLVADDVVDFQGEASELSEGEVVVRLTNEQAVEFFEGIGNTRPLAEVIFLADGEVLLGQIDRVVIESERFLVTLRIGFLHSMAPESIFPGEPVESRRIVLQLDDTGDSLPLTSLVQALYWLVQGLESTRIAAQDLLDQLAPDHSLELPPPKILSVRMDSPLRAVIETALPYGETFVLMYLAYAVASKQWWDRQVAKETARRLRWENEKEGITRRLRVSEAIGLLQERLRDALRRSGTIVQEDQEVDTAQAEILMKKQIVPSIQELNSLPEGVAQLELEGGPATFPELFSSEEVDGPTRTIRVAGPRLDRAVEPAEQALDEGAAELGPPAE